MIDRARAWRRLGTWLLPPLCAAVAAAVHFRLNVPWDRVATAKPEPARGGEPEPPKFVPRSQEELDALEQRYAAAPIEDEPVASGWARAHQSKARKAFVLARQQAFEGAPDRPQVIVTEVECHTIRCLLVLRSEYAHELWQLADTMRVLEVDGRPLWHDFAPQVREENTPGDDADDPGESHAYLEILVQFRDDTVVVDAADPGEE